MWEPGECHWQILTHDSFWPLPNTFIYIGIRCLNTSVAVGLKVLPRIRDSTEMASERTAMKGQEAFVSLSNSLGLWFPLLWFPLLLSLPAISVLQSSWDTLFTAAALLGWTEIQPLIQRKETWKICECLVRAALKAFQMTERAPVKPDPRFDMALDVGNLFLGRLVWEGSFPRLCSIPDPELLEGWASSCSYVCDSSYPAQDIGVGSGV